MAPFVFSYELEAYHQGQIEASCKLAQSQASEQSGYVFVSVEHGGDEARKKVSRRLVRSRATAYSHRMAPRGAPKPDVILRVLPGSDNRQTSTRSSLQSLLPSSSASSSCSRTARKQPRYSPQPGPTIGQSRLANTSRKRISPIVTQAPSTNGDRERSTHRRSTSKGSNRSISPGPFEFALPHPAGMDASMRDPFNTCPVQQKDWYGKLISFWYGVVFTRSTRVLKATKSELDAYTVWSRRQELQEPALFYCALFLASGIPVAEGLFPVQTALWLRYKTVEAMKEALDDPVRSLSNPIILAVGRIALHEHIYGNKELAHHVHRPAQLRMINMRGGLINLGLPATTIQLIVWTDALLSAEAGTTPYFADVPKQLAIRSYSPEEAMHVTNYCSPKRRSHPGYGKAK